MKNSKKVSDISLMNDEKLAKFWDNNDRESKRSGIDRAQLVRSWVKEKISHMHNDERL